MVDLGTGIRPESLPPAEDVKKVERRLTSDEKSMNSKDISNARDPDLRASHEALRRASELARKTAIQTGTDLIIVQDGKTVRIPPAMLHEQSQPKPVPTP